MVVALFALLDAGWSGDWSRIGAISVEQEAQARAVLQSILTFQCETPTHIPFVWVGVCGRELDRDARQEVRLDLLKHTRPKGPTRLSYTMQVGTHFQHTKRLPTFGLDCAFPVATFCGAMEMVRSLLVGPFSAILAYKRGQPVLAPFAKTMLIGGLALFEVSTRWFF